MQGKVSALRLAAVFSLAVCLLFPPLTSLAQFRQGQNQPAAPPINQSDDPLLKKFVWRSIGPAGMGGRIDDIAAVESNPFIIYVAFATGGLWKTVNNGTTWEPIFDTYSTASIGDVAVCQTDPNIVWVGTGEPNNRQSSSFGDGIYKSTDGGKTFTNMGLRETQTISRIVIDPRDPNVVYVAALGHLFGANRERGIYKTTDGGKTWNQVKFIDENTGFTDLVIDPSDGRTLYAASYQRRRTPWGFNGGGPGSALWKTTDAGKTWTKLEGNGLPEGVLGRIGIDLARSNPNVIYAQFEVGTSTGTGVPEEQPQSPGQPGQPGQPPAAMAEMTGQNQAANQPPNPKRSGIWRSDDKGKTWRVVSNNNNRPMYYSQIRVDPGNAENVYTGGLNFTKSTDGGKTFRIMQGIAHSDHHAIWINPKNGNQIIIGNDGGLDVTYDQGETWEFVNTIAAAQFYAVSADMRKPYYVCGGLQDNGSWCGPSAVRTGGGGFGGGGGGAGGAGITNAEWFRVGGGDGFYTQNDPTDHNIIYAESQNGAVVRLDLRTGQSRSIRPRAAQRPRQQGPRQAEPNPEQTPTAQPGAQGQPAQQSPTPEQIQMMMAQSGGFGGGNPFQSNIVPAPPQGEQYRFNWNTPVHLSPHNPRTIYVGANRLFRSLDRGDTWTFASPDLTKQIDRSKLPIMGVDGKDPMASKHDGTANYSNITTIAESPALPGVLWVGTDDGNVQLSKDGGTTWTNVAKNISGVSGDTYLVSRVEPSHFDAATCYVTLDNHRNDDLKPYAFVTRDYGATWSSVVGNLPAGNVNVIREDLKNKNLLFAGTEFGLFVSTSGGAEWKKFMTGLPTVPVDDILIHPRDNDLIVGTHGRGIYICDDITPLQQLSEKVMLADAHLFDVRPGVEWLTDATLSRAGGGAKNFRGANAPAGTAISYYLKSAPGGDVKITISDVTGKVVRNLTGTKEAGVNRVQWNLRGDPPPRPAGFGPPGGGAPTADNPQPAGGSQQPAAQPGQQPAGQGRGQGRGQGGGGGGGGGGGRFGALVGPALEPGTYLVKLSVDGKEMTTKVVVEADTWKDK
ncbi:MAG TPA: hypothetical protein VFD58_37325 [Blastocatellia bacterium]|nr:hypothetical protein [Blastocatellia bacterium]